MLHLIYILAFTILAFLAVRNLIHSLMTVGMESQRAPGSRPSNSLSQYPQESVPHPELLDEFGNIVKEPLLVMRSLSVQEARSQLDSLYNASANSSEEPREES